MKVGIDVAARYEIFRSSIESWPTLFDKAVEFATRVGRENVISISHSDDRNNGVVVVWYWEAAASHQLDYAGQTPVPAAAFDDFGDGVRGPDPTDLIDQENDEEDDDKESK